MFGGRPEAAFANHLQRNVDGFPVRRAFSRGLQGLFPIQNTPFLLERYVFALRVRMVSHSLIIKTCGGLTMTNAALRAAYSEEILTAARHGKHKLDELDASRFAKHLMLFRPSQEVVEEVVERARKAIPGLGQTSDVLKIV